MVVVYLHSSTTSKLLFSLWRCQHFGEIDLYFLNTKAWIERNLSWITLFIFSTLLAFFFSFSLKARIEKMIFFVIGFSALADLWLWNHFHHFHFHPIFLFLISYVQLLFFSAVNRILQVYFWIKWYHLVDV